MLLGVVGSGKSCGAAAYNCDLLTLAAHLGYSQQLLERALCRLKLCAADIHGTLVVVAHTLIHAVMGAYGTGDKGQGVLCGYNLQCLKEQSLAAKLYVFGYILTEGAAALAGSPEAVYQRKLLALAHLPVRRFLYGLNIVEIGGRLLGKPGHGLIVHAGEGLELAPVKQVAQLHHAAVSAGLQYGGSHGYGPYARLKQLLYVKEVCAAAVGYAKRALELVCKTVGHLYGQGIQSAAAHVHLLAGQLVCLYVHREGVGELQPKLQAVLFRQLLEPVEHRNGVLILEVLAEVPVVKSNVVIAHGVEP